MLFWLTYCINVTFNIVAFTEVFMSTFFSSHNTHWVRFACSSITLFSLFLVAYKGAATFAKLNVFIFACLVVSVFCGIVKSKTTIWHI